jgi:hypothetical protein
VFVAVNLWRVLMLGGPGGYWWPSVSDLILNKLRGPIYVLLLQLRGPLWTQWASVASLVCLLAAARLTWVHRTAPVARVAVVGVVLLIMANAPLMLMTSRRRGYLLALAASFMLTAGIVFLARSLQQTRGNRVAVSVLAAVSVAFVATSANRLQTFGPCSVDSHTNDQWLRRDMVQYLAPELGPWLDHRIEACDPATYRPIVETLPVATWSHTGGATMLVNENARAVGVRLRVTGTTPAAVQVSVNHRPSREILVEPGQWIEVPVPLDASWLTPLRRSHRLDIRTGDVAVEIRSGDVIY